MKRAVTVIVILALVVGLGFVGYRAFARRGSEPLAEMETVPVERGILVATVNVSGSVATKAQVMLTFKTPGRVAEIRVDEGDWVEVGEVLAKVETKHLELAVAQAEAALAQAEAQLRRTERGASAHDLAIAEASLASAEANLAWLLAGADDRVIEIARINWEQAKSSLWAVQAERDGVAGNKMTPRYMVDAANARVATAETAVRIAELRYEQAQAGPGEYELAIARAQVDQARAALAQARLQLEDAVLVAPFAGTVASVDVSVGELASSAKPAIVLVDVGALHLDVAVDETDIGRIRVGQEANVFLDAFPDVELKGRVARIDPVGTVVQGVVTYEVRIEIAPMEVPIKPGMTANVDILVERKEGVLVVPTRALRCDQKGKYVEVLADGQRQRRYVTTGLSSEAFTEVVEGLGEGEQVIVSAPRESILERGGFRFPFGGR